MFVRLLLWIALTWPGWWPTDPDGVCLSRDLPRFPTEEQCEALEKVAGDYRQSVHVFYGTADSNFRTGRTWTLPLSEQKRLADLDQSLLDRWLIYAYLAAAQNVMMGHACRRQSLAKARALMGEKAFWAGTPPPPIPVELLREYP